MTNLPGRRCFALWGSASRSLDRLCTVLVHSACVPIRSWEVFCELPTEQSADDDTNIQSAFRCVTVGQGVGDGKVESGGRAAW